MSQRACDTHNSLLRPHNFWISEIETGVCVCICMYMRHASCGEAYRELPHPQNVWISKIGTGVCVSHICISAPNMYARLTTHCLMHKTLDFRNGGVCVYTYIHICRTRKVRAGLTTHCQIHRISEFSGIDKGDYICKYAHVFNNMSCHETYVRIDICACEAYNPLPHSRCCAHGSRRTYIHVHIYNTYMYIYVYIHIYIIIHIYV